MTLRLWTDKVDTSVSCGCDHSSSYYVYHDAMAWMEDWPASWIAVEIVLWIIALGLSALSVFSIIQLCMIVFEKLKCVTGRRDK